MAKLIMLGGPGSGKGTQSRQLSQDLNIPVIATGDILRKAIPSGSALQPAQRHFVIDNQTPLGCEAQIYLEKGELVPDIIMIEFMKERLMQSDVQEGWILEGYPRTAFQAEELDFLLEKLQQKLDWAIYLKVSEKIMIERSLKKGEIDDKLDIINRRIELFHERTIPILEYYDYNKKLLTIDANGNPEEVEAEIFKQLK